MRKSFALLSIVALSLSLAACGATTPPKARPSSASTPTASVTPSAPPVPQDAKPARTLPLTALTNANILEYCPAIPATHFDGKTSGISKIVICTSVTSATGTTESASSVNYGSEALLSAYGAANAKKTQGACIQVAKDPLIIWLTGADGKILPMYAPVDQCGFPSADAVNAYQSAGLQILWEADLDANGAPTTP